MTNEESKQIPEFCIFCDSKADYRIDRNNSGICYNCSAPYECGQSNPDGGLTNIEEIRKEAKNE